MMQIQVNGIKLHVEISGDGPPLLLLHGFTGSCRTWDPFLHSWTKSNRVIAVDIIGHGESEAPVDPARYSMENGVEDLAALLDYLEIGEVSVLGYSMGGRLALSFTVLQPARVRALLLESSSPGLKTSGEKEARAAQDEKLAERIELEGIGWFTEYWENIPLFQSLKRLPEEVQLKINRQRLNNQSIGLANSLRGMGTGAQCSWWNDLKALQMPVLLIAGEQDEKFCQIAREMETLFANGSLITIPQAGHMIHVEQAEMFDTIVRNYLTSV
jgi:2-succinyl-6-hydroxy-2,4-cyclohexadiene-1-carboxylate synthase